MWTKLLHSHKTWAEVSSSALHLLPTGLSIDPIMLRCSHVLFKEPTNPWCYDKSSTSRPPGGGSGPTNRWAASSSARSMADAFPFIPLCSVTQMRPTETWLVIQYEIFCRTLHALSFLTVPGYVIPDCVWHCSCVFKHPVYAVVTCCLECHQNSIELKE